MMNEICNYDANLEWHGYNQWVDSDCGILWMRGIYKHGQSLGYHEVNTDTGGIGDYGTKIQFYIG